MAAERKIYGLEENEWSRVIHVYEQTGSFESTGEQTYFSAGHVARVVNEAISRGWLDEEVKQPVGKPRKDRNRISYLLDEFPWATTAQIAALAGCSEATVYRAKRGE